MTALEELYLNHPECLISVFDLRLAGAAAALHRQRARWTEYSDLEALDEDQFALVVRLDWVTEAVA
jgi:hypothetical protein